MVKKKAEIHKINENASFIKPLKREIIAETTIMDRINISS
jgi:hypothetical protein